MYAKLKAEKLVVEFNYLIGKEYFPFGIEGRVFNITDVKSILSELKNINYAEQQAKLKSNPNYLNDKKEAHSKGENWIVVLKISNKDDEIEIELNDALKVLKIRNDIDKIFNN